MNRVIFTLGVAAALAGLAGCATAPSAPPAPSAAAAVSSAEPFVPLDQATTESVVIAALQQRTLADGRLEILASLRNRTAGPLRLGVACLFKNAQGAVTGEAVSWHTITLAGNTTETLRFTAADARAERFTIAAREAK